MATVVEELVVRIGADVEELRRKLGESDEKVDKFSKRVDEKAKRLAKNIGRMAAAGFVGVTAFSIHAAIRFEEEFANVRKTVDATEDQFNALQRTIREMATDDANPLSALEGAHETLTQIMAMGGQLGVPVENLQEFTQVVGEMTVATNLSAEAAGNFFARFGAVTGLDPSQYRDLGNAVVDLGNNMAANEDEIASFALALAPLAQYKVPVADIVGLAAGLVALGVAPEMGATALTRTVQDMERAAATGDGLQAFADAANMSADAFAEMIANNPADAVMAFVNGLRELPAGEQLQVLDELGITESRQVSLLQRMAGGYDTLTMALEISNDAFKDSNALSDEAQKKADTTAGSIEKFKNNVKDLGIGLGQNLLPVLNPVIEGFTTMLNQSPGLATGIVLITTGVIGLGAVLPAAQTGLAALGVIAGTAAVPIVAAAVAILGAVDAVNDFNTAVGEALEEGAELGAMIEPGAAGSGKTRQEFEDEIFNELVNQVGDFGAHYYWGTATFQAEVAAAWEAYQATMTDYFQKAKPRQDAFTSTGLPTGEERGGNLAELGFGKDFNAELQTSLDKEAPFEVDIELDPIPEFDLPITVIQASIAEQLGNVTFEASAPFIITPSTVSVYGLNTNVGGSRSGGGGGSSGGGSSVTFSGVPEFDGGGLAMLHDGEVIRTPLQERQLQAGRGGTTIVNSYGTNPYELVRLTERARRNVGGRHG